MHELDLVVRLTSPSGPNGGSRSSRWLRPFSSTITDQPAAVRTSATVAPPGPLPDDDGVAVVVSQRAVRRPRRRCSRGAGRRRGTRSRASRRRRGCRRTRVRRTRPRTRARTAAAELGDRASSRASCSSAASVGEVGAERGDAVAVLAPASPTTGPLNSRSGRPCDPSMRVRQASSSSGRAARNCSKPARRRAGPRTGRRPRCGAGRRERAEQPVDVVGDAERRWRPGARRPAGSAARTRLDRVRRIEETMLGASKLGCGTVGKPPSTRRLRDRELVVARLVEAGGRARAAHHHRERLLDERRPAHLDAGTEQRAVVDGRVHEPDP